MAAKIIRKEGKKLIIEISIDLEDSMLDNEEAIQAVINEAGNSVFILFLKNDHNSSICINSTVNVIDKQITSLTFNW